MNLAIIDKKLNLERELDQARNELCDYDNLGDLRTQAGIKRTVFSQNVERSKFYGGLFVAGLTDEIENLEEDAAKAEKLVIEAERKQQDLRERISELEVELGKIDITANQADLVEIQKKKAVVEELMEKIKKTIDLEEQKLVLVAIDESHPLHALRAKREELLAEIALGNTEKRKDLGALQEQLDGEEKSYSDLVEAATDTRHGVNGLKAKLAELERELSSLEKYHAELFVAFLRMEVGDVAKEYSSSASKAFDAFVKIAALEAIANRYGVNLRAIPTGGPTFKIPALNLPGCQPVEGPKYHGCLFSYIAGDSQKASLAVLDGYLEKGIVAPAVAV